MRQSWIYILPLSIITPLLIRSYIEAHNSLTLGKNFEKSGALKQAILEYSDAVSWNSPFNFYADQAREQLTRLIVSDALSKELKLQGLLELKRGLTSSRGILSSFEDQRLLANLEDEVRKLVGGESKIRDLHPPKVSFVYQLLAQLAFWIWILATISTIWTGVTSKGEIVKGRFISGIGLASIFFLIWLYLLTFA